MRPKIIPAGSVATADAAPHAHTDTAPPDAWYTPNEKFFTQHVKQIPEINADYWSLMLAGEVDIPLIVSHKDLLAMPQTEIACTLACAGQQPENDMIGHALWQGVRFDHLLQQVRLKPSVLYARFYAADGYVTSLPLTETSDLIIVHQMNGKPLSLEHGYPARLIAPGLYGYKMPRWLRRIELAQKPVAGFWEKRGWHSSGEAHSAIHVTCPHYQRQAHKIEISGMAYGGMNPLATVEVSLDGGPWMPVDFEPPSRFSWTRWSIDWFAATPGSYQVTAQAINTLDQIATHTTLLHIQ